MYQISDEVRRLTNIEKQQYSEQGYVKNLPVFSNDGVSELQELFEELITFFEEPSMEIL